MTDWLIFFTVVFGLLFGAPVALVFWFKYLFWVAEKLFGR